MINPILPVIPGSVDPGSIIYLYYLLLSWMPSWIQVCILGFLVIVAVYGIIKLVGMILDALPFV